MENIHIIGWKKLTWLDYKKETSSCTVDWSVQI